jgi:FSR family fosmidomycin resistance protein-like MFS transporter
MSIFNTGGQIGFAVGPVLVTAAILACGLKGTLFFIMPVTVAALLLVGTGTQLAKREGKADGGVRMREDAPDEWGAFGRLTAAIMIRSIIFYGLNTFLPLYWLNFFHQSKEASGIILTVYFTAGVLGTLLGGRFGDRFEYRRIVLVSLLSTTLVLPVFLYLETALGAALLLVPIGFLFFLSSSPFVVMGQEYLPNHIGLASGVTLGLSITVGGLAMPLLGRIGDIYGIHSALTGIACLPLICACLVLTLPRSRTAVRVSSLPEPAKGSR